VEDMGEPLLEEQSEVRLVVQSVGQYQMPQSFLKK
jgi:hypothetical protein